MPKNEKQKLNQFLVCPNHFEYYAAASSINNRFKVIFVPQGFSNDRSWWMQNSNVDFDDCISQLIWLEFNWKERQTLILLLLSFLFDYIQKGKETIGAIHSTAQLLCSRFSFKRGRIESQSSRKRTSSYYSITGPTKQWQWTWLENSSRTEILQNKQTKNRLPKKPTSRFQEVEYITYHPQLPCLSYRCASCVWMSNLIRHLRSRRNREKCAAIYIIYVRIYSTLFEWISRSFVPCRQTTTVGPDGIQPNPTFLSRLICPKIFCRLMVRLFGSIYAHPSVFDRKKDIDIFANVISRNY